MQHDTCIRVLVWTRHMYPGASLAPVCVVYLSGCWMRWLVDPGAEWGSPTNHTHWPWHYACRRRQMNSPWMTLMTLCMETKTMRSPCMTTAWGTLMNHEAWRQCWIRGRSGELSNSALLNKRQDMSRHGATLPWSTRNQHCFASITFESAGAERLRNLWWK